jgi:RimJ/RimL family protein N-acetyltransferase
LPTTSLINRLQEYFRRSVGQRSETVAIPPFTLFFHPTQPTKYANYAIPDAPITGDVSRPLATLKAEFIKRGRLPRLEYVQDYAPALALGLAGAGFEEEGRYQLMACTEADYRPAPAVARLRLKQLAADSPDRDVEAAMHVQRVGFGGDDSPTTPADVANFRFWFDHATFFLGLLDGEPVGVASFTTPIDGVTEIAGVATLLAYRRQGIATALTGACLQLAFGQGVEVACLTAADAQAGRVYERVGFRAVGTGLAYNAPAG